MFINKKIESMKKLIIGILSTIMVVSILLTTSCVKDDLTAPVITLDGDNPMTIDLNEVWADVDPGATANDNEDGDLSASIVVTNTPDVDLAGEYDVLYSVTDLAGNIGTATRKVYVNNAVLNLEGVYNVLDSIIGGSNYNYTDNITASGTVNNRIFVEKFAGYVNGSVYFDINGTNITIPVQTVTCGNPSADRDFSGTGTINGAVLTINYTELTSGTTVSGVEIYTKQ